MNALRSPEPPRRPRYRRKRLPKRQYKGAVVVEIGVKVIANGILSLAALTALAKLLPHHFSQQGKLKDIQQEVSTTEKRVNDLREKLEYTLGTDTQDEVMAEQTGLKDPKRLPIVFQEKNR